MLEDFGREIAQHFVSNNTNIFIMHIFIMMPLNASQMVEQIQHLMMHCKINFKNA